MAHAAPASVLYRERERKQTSVGTPSLSPGSASGGGGAGACSLPSLRLGVGGSVRCQGQEGGGAGIKQLPHKVTAAYINF